MNLKSLILKNPAAVLKYAVLTSLMIFLCSCHGFSGGKSKLDKAEDLVQQEKYEEAITIYKEHMSERLSAKNRPDWENPYFYYLLIGDIELRRSNVNAAIEAYKTAQANDIPINLISDRMRYIATWYEEKGEYEEALAILKANRQLDPLLFDSMLDRISKDLILKQDSEKDREKQATPKPAAK